MINRLNFQPDREIDAMLNVNLKGADNDLQNSNEDIWLT